MRKSYRCFRSTPPNIGEKQTNYGIHNLKSWVLSDWPVILYLFVFIVVPYVIILSLFIFSLISKLT
jgi:hypothetical protein